MKPRKSLLECPDAERLLGEAVVTPDVVGGCARRLTQFLERCLPLFERREQRDNFTVVMKGRLSGLERKTSEPIAYGAGVARKPIQHFVGNGPWDDEAVMAEMRRHVVAEIVVAEIGAPEGVLVVDGSAFPKKGTASCGVARQWCGRLGKTDNCQHGVFLAYVVGAQYAPLDRRLDLPEEWAGSTKRRKPCHVPQSVRFEEKWKIALKLIDRCRHVPHAWITGDDEFGRVIALRARLRRWKERDVLDVPCSTLVRDLSETPPPRQSPRGRKFQPPFRRVDAWAALQPASQWQTFTVRDGEKGPLKVQAVSRQVRAKGERSRIGAEERLVVFRTLESPSRTCYCLSNADRETPLADVLEARGARPRVEQMFEEGNGDVGLDHYEVRSWTGWHHHMTLSLLALWFLVLERRQCQKKRPRSRSVKPDTS